MSYDVIEKGKSYSYFKVGQTVPDNEPEKYRRDKTLSTRVWDLLSQSMEVRPAEDLSVEDTVNSLIQQYPEYKDLQRKTFSGRISGILSNFEKQGYVQRKKFDKLFHSELTLSVQQREAIVSLVTLIDKFKNGDRETMEEGRRFAQRVASDPNLFSELMLKAKEASPFAKRTNREDMHSYILSILQAQPSSINQILEKLEEDYDKRLKRVGLRSHLSVLINDGKIISEQTKSGNVYRVVGTGNKE